MDITKFYAYDNANFFAELKETLEVDLFDEFDCLLEELNDEYSFVLGNKVEEVKDSIYSKLEDGLDFNLDSYLEKIADEAFEEGDEVGYDRGYEAASDEYEDYVSQDHIDQYYYHCDYVYEEYISRDEHTREMEELRDEIEALENDNEELNELRQEIAELKEQLLIQESAEDLRYAMREDIRAELEAEMTIARFEEESR